eukprot:scaffold178_cov163-Amphora_coffeaeformis.AAC.4
MARRQQCTSHRPQHRVDECDLKNHYGTTTKSLTYFPNEFDSIDENDSLLRQQRMGIRQVKPDRATDAFSRHETGTKHPYTELAIQSISGRLPTPTVLLLSGARDMSFPDAYIYR